MKRLIPLTITALSLQISLLVGIQQAIAQQVDLPRDVINVGSSRLLADPGSLRLATVPDATHEIAATPAKQGYVDNNPLPKYFNSEVVNATPPGTRVGYTFYDFQTNACMPDKLAYFKEGNDHFVHMVWMASLDPTRDVQSRTPGFNDSRGSHYAFFDVSNPDAPDNLIEGWRKLPVEGNQRTGWATIACDKTGRATIVAHTPVRAFYNDLIGSDDFFELQPPAGQTESLWPRVAVDGSDRMHVIYNRRISDAGGDRNEVCYVRSTTGGNSWSAEVQFTGPNAIQLPSGVTTVPSGAGGDSYAIAARDNNIIVAYLDGPLRVLFRKSTDGGETWQLGLAWAATHTPVDSTYYAGDSIVVYTDTTIAPSLQLDVALDSRGRAHFIMGETLTYIIQRGLANNSTQRRGIIYNVSDDALYRGLGLVHVVEGDTVGSRFAIMGANLWDGEGTLVSRRAYTGVSRYPQAALDAGDSIYVAFAGPKTGDWVEMQIDTTPRYDPNEPDTLITVNGLYHHVYATHRQANGSRWSTPLQITPDGINCAFPSIADEVSNNRIYLGYSAGRLPGDRVTSLELPVDTTHIYFHTISTASLNPTTSIQDVSQAEFQIRITPNPVADQATVYLSGVEGEGTVSIKLVSLTGHILMQIDNLPLNDGSGVGIISLQTLTPGVYLCMVSAGGRNVTEIVRVLR